MVQLYLLQISSELTLFWPLKTHIGRNVWLGVIQFLHQCRVLIGNELAGTLLFLSHELLWHMIDGGPLFNFEPIVKLVETCVLEVLCNFIWCSLKLLGFKLLLLTKSFEVRPYWFDFTHYRGGTMSKACILIKPWVTAAHPRHRTILVPVLRRHILARALLS